VNLLNSKLSTVLTILQKKLIQTRISSKKVQIFNETTRSGFMRNFKVIIFEIFGSNLNVPSKIEKYMNLYKRTSLKNCLEKPICTPLL
jgi:hypothetical protein